VSHPGAYAGVPDLFAAGEDEHDLGAGERLPGEFFGELEDRGDAGRVVLAPGAVGWRTDSAIVRPAAPSSACATRRAGLPGIAPAAIPASSGAWLGIVRPVCREDQRLAAVTRGCQTSAPWAASWCATSSSVRRGAPAAGIRPLTVVPDPAGSSRLTHWLRPLVSNS
jgi:hypothetical protein